jgi:hypothetical protein
LYLKFIQSEKPRKDVERYSSGDFSNVLPVAGGRGVGINLRDVQAPDKDGIIGGRGWLLIAITI